MLGCHRYHHCCPVTSPRRDSEAQRFSVLLGREAADNKTPFLPSLSSTILPPWKEREGEMAHAV